MPRRRIAFEMYGIEKRKDKEEKDRTNAEDLALELATNSSETLGNVEASIVKLSEALRRVKTGDRVLIYERFVSNIRGVEGEKKELLHMLGEKAYRSSFKSPT